MSRVVLPRQAFEQFVDSLKRLFVDVLSLRVVVPRPVVPEFLHATALRRRFMPRRDFAAGSSSILKDICVMAVLLLCCNDNYTKVPNAESMTTGGNYE